MPSNLRVIRSQEFVRLDAHGRNDMEQSRLALNEVAAACNESGIDCALIDVRDMEEGVMSSTDLYELARTFHTTGFQPHHRLAILHRYSSGQRADFFALCATHRGWNVRAFDSFEEAYEWLSAPDSFVPPDPLIAPDRAAPGTDG